MRPFRHGKVGDQWKLGIFLLPNPMLPVELTPASLLRGDLAVPGQRWQLFLQHLCSPAAPIWAGDMPHPEMRCAGMFCAQRSQNAGDEGTEGLCVCGATFPATRGAPVALQGHHQWAGWGHSLPSCRCHCLQVLQGEGWCPAGHRQPGRKGRKGCGGRGTKGNSLTEGRGGFGLVFIFNNGQL